MTNKQNVISQFYTISPSVKPSNRLRLNDSQNGDEAVNFFGCSLNVITSFYWIKHYAVFEFISAS